MVLASFSAPISPDAPRLKGLRLLLAEASAHQQELGRDLLESEGAQIISVTSSALALEVLRDGRTFDAALLAADLPPMDGVAATVQLRRLPPLRRLPVVALRSPAVSPEAETCFMAGMNDHLELPLDLEPLVAILLRLTHRSATASATTKSIALSEAAQRYAAAHSIELIPALQRLSGTRTNALARYQRYLQSFLEDSSHLPTRIHTLLEACDLNTVSLQWRELHALANTLGLVELSHTAAQAQRAAHQAALQQEHPAQSRVHAAQVALVLAAAQTHAAHLAHVLQAE